MNTHLNHQKGNSMPDAMRRYQPPVTGRWMPKEGT